MVIIVVTTYSDGGGAGHVVHQRQLAEAALVVVAAHLLRLCAAVHFDVDAVLATVDRRELGSVAGERHTSDRRHLLHGATECSSIGDTAPRETLGPACMFTE